MNQVDYIQHCNELAAKGIGYVSPNPLVGAIIVKDNKIIAEGYHHRHGDVHAEIDALNKISPNFDLSDATLYVNLEPCSHSNSEKINPPCAPEVVNRGIRHVVISMTDPNPLVNGNGIKFLKKHNVKVDLVNPHFESRYLNRFFIVNQKYNRPFVTLKIAQTLDGQIATKSLDSQWITNESARQIGHQMRHAHDAILVGSGTVNSDNPSLDVRLVEGKNPIRVVIDSNLKTAPNANIFTDKKAKTILFTASKQVKDFENDFVECIQIDKSNQFLNLTLVLDHLYTREINSVLIEGGQGMSTAFLKNNLVDELVMMIAPKIIGHGIGAIGDLKIDKMNEAIEFRSIKTNIVDNQIIFKGMLNSCLQD